MGWNHYSDKKRCKILLLFATGVVLLTLLMPFRRTVDAKRNCFRLTKSIEEARQASLQIDELRKKMALWEEGMNVNLTRDGFRDYLFKTSGELSVRNSVRVNGIALLYEQIDGDFNFDTYEMILCGGFHELIKSVYWLETKSNHGRILSVGYSLVKNNHTRDIELQARIILQSITRHEKLF